MKFRASDVKVMFIIITCISTIIYLNIYIGRILHSSTVSVGLAQARLNNYMFVLVSVRCTYIYNNNYYYNIVSYDLIIIIII